MEYEKALIQFKKIDVQSSIEDIFGLARVFYKLEKYQQCTKSKYIWNLNLNQYLLVSTLKIYKP